MIDQDALTALLETEKAGFKLIKAEADKALNTMSESDCLYLAKHMYTSKVYQARMFATLILGKLAAAHKEAYDWLRTQVIYDQDWRTQEMLARAFDQYCKDKGYEQALPEIKQWLKAKEPNQRRAASEGLRIWTSRSYFKEHPGVAITLLAGLRADKSEYVRKSVGNALRDISKTHPDLVRQELKKSDLSDANTTFTYKLAQKFIMSPHLP